MKDKCVILVTHQVQLLTNVEKILVLDDGRIIESGSYTEINGKDFSPKLSKSNIKES